MVLFYKIDATLPLKYKLKHLCYEFLDHNQILLSFTELPQAHKIFWHAPPSSVYNVLKHGYPIETSSSGLKKLTEITAQCMACQLKVRGLNRTLVIIPEQCVFNLDVSIEVMFEEQTPILKAVYRHTHF